MKVLGINQVPGMLGGMHDSAAALVIDGKIIATAEEERFNRQRHSKGYPKLAVEYCLKEGGISMDDLDYIVIANNPWKLFTKLRISLVPMNLVQNIANIFIFELFKAQLKSDTNAKVVYVEHHLAHAASAYYCAGVDEANVLTIDGSGETESFAFFVGKAGKLKRIWDIPFSRFFHKKKWQSIGGVYSRVTAFLKLGLHAEGKTMGLASYGTPAYDFSEILNIKSHNNFTIDRRNLDRLYPELERKDSNATLTQEHKDLAASLQEALEQSVVNLSREAYEFSGIRNFAFAGGVALNCNSNTRVLLEDFCDALFLQPAAHDGGTSLGAALEISARHGEIPNEKLIHAYYGPGYSNTEIKELLDNAMVKYVYHDDIEKETAKLVCEGKIVAWFQGRMEMGPRALGNRTILGDPTIKGIDDKINEQVKHREVWRPFAPSVTEEDATKFFEGVNKAEESPFMLHTFYVKEKYKDQFPSVTHVDGSSRIQTVRKDQNERYYKLLKEIEAINGYPIVLDTSFNDQGEPIICSPKDALRCYFSTGIDALAIGNFMLQK
ncbi:hypothetical protein N8083_00200 [Candidatus Pacebacteria bacterium]|nr:hypothetical protein [Candidatus Paceibacterota bacterium]